MESDILKKEQEILKSYSDKDFLYRMLEKTDYKTGFLDILAQLTVVGNVSKEEFEQRFDEIFPDQADIYKIVVIVDRENDQIIGAGTVFFEKKFIRGLGCIGHIEDVNIEPSYKGKSLVVKLIEIFKKFTEMNECYKIILDCADHNIKFYELLGFKLNDRCMCWYRQENRL